MSFGSPASTAVAAFVARLVEQNVQNYAALHALIVNMSVTEFTSFCQQQEQIAAAAAPRKATTTRAAARIITDPSMNSEVIPGMSALTVTAPKPRSKKSAAANAMNFGWDGQMAQPANTPAVNASNAFSQPNAFAAPAQAAQPNAFAAQPNAFAAPVQQAQPNAFAAQPNAFAAPVQQAQPNAFAAPAPAANPFAMPAEAAAPVAGAVVW
jgi:hypothetical protein